MNGVKNLVNEAAMAHPHARCVSETFDLTLVVRCNLTPHSDGN
jgi:hypothetical protein